MAQKLVTDYVITSVPGVYPKQEVKSVAVGLATTGVVALVGEAEGGASFKDEASLKDNFYGTDSLDSVESKYIGGRIVDAMRLLAAPGADTRIRGSASRVYPIKTNRGTKASLVVPVPTTYGTYFSKNYGTLQNKIAVELNQVQAEVRPTFTGGLIDFVLASALNGAIFTIRKQGLVETTITLSAVTTDHDTIAKLVLEIAPQMPAGMTVSNIGDKLILSYNAITNSEYKGYSLNFEISGDPADLNVLGLDKVLVKSSAELIEEIHITNDSTGLNEYKTVGGNVYFEIGYLGEAGTLTISNANILTTTGLPIDLNIDLNTISTLKDLAEVIKSVDPLFSASAVDAFRSKSPLLLDRVTAIGLSSTEAGVKPLRIKADAYDFNRKANESTALSFVIGAKSGLPKKHTKQFLAGGAKGSTTALDIVDAFGALEGLKVNFVVPLMSADAVVDIDSGATESSSTYTIDAIHALAKTHALAMSTAKIKKNRQCVLSVADEYSVCKAKSGVMGDPRVAVTMQPVTQVDSFGVVQEYQPWASAVIAAGMQCAGFYKAIVKKTANIINFIDPVGFDSGNMTQVEDALESGLLFLEKNGQTSRWVSDQTSYGFDSNFVFNSLQAVYAADLVTLTLAESIDNRFTGESLADIDIATVQGFITTKMDELKRAKLVAGSKDAPLAWKGLKIKINGPVMSIKIEVKLATSVYFIPLEIQFSEVQLEGSL